LVKIKLQEDTAQTDRLVVVEMSP